MSLTTAYTHVESFLLFQALRSEGVNSHSVFNRISDQLKSIPIVRNDPSFDQGRLSPDALRELYLWLLKEEVKRDLDRQAEREKLLLNGDASSASRKRKAPSPTLPTVHEASQHAHLIPQLLTRLYTRYRDHAVRDIRDHERRYDALTRELAEIEAGKWDERLQRQRTVSATQSPLPSSSAHTQPVLSRADHLQPTKSTTASPVSSHKTLENNNAPPPSKPYSRSKIGDVINHGPEPQNGVAGHQRSASNTSLPPLHEMAPQSPRFGIPPAIPPPLNTQMSNHAFNQSPPSAHQSPYASQHGYPVGGSTASPQVQNSLSRPSSSPRPILPPPPGMKLPPPSPQQTGSPNMRGPPLPPQQHYQQPPPHRLSTGPSPTHERPPRGYPPPQLPSHPSGYYQQSPYPDRRAPYPPPQQHVQPGFPNQAPHAGGYQLPPFSVEPHDPNMRRTSQPMMSQRQQSFSQQPAVPTQRPSYPPHPQTAPSTGPRPAPHANGRIVSDIIATLATPPRPQWKSAFKRPPHIGVGMSQELPSPASEPLSPVLKRSEPAARSTRSTRNREAEPSEPSAEPETISKPPRRTRKRVKRDRSPNSVVSSTADESARMTRSQSVSTVAGAVATSDDRPGSRGNVKIEPSTPAGFVDDAEPTHEVPSGGRMTRKRRGTLQSLPQPPSKKKRQRSPSIAAEDQASFELGTPPPQPTTVHATRNFHKTSSTIMNDIISHKHASYFANAVREKDAPGYSEIIKQPQHLKSIRAAISAGNKAVNAAASTLDSPSGTPIAPKTAADGSSTVELDRTAELVPPKAIVNGSQLEKEVMRMFANAVMFNPGEDGMVSDTREMFEDVEAKLREWRGAEKESGDVDEEEGKGKRRKL